MTTTDHIVRILTDGRPLSDVEIHARMRSEGLENSFATVRRTMVTMKQRGVIIPAAGHALHGGASSLHRFVLTAKPPTTV